MVARHTATARARVPAPLEVRASHVAALVRRDSSPPTWLDAHLRRHTLTRWMLPPLRPAAPGVYQRLGLSGQVMFSRWTGAAWMWNTHTPREAALSTAPSLVQHLPWRGLAAPYVAQSTIQLYITE